MSHIKNQMPTSLSAPAPQQPLKEEAMDKDELIEEISKQTDLNALKEIAEECRTRIKRLSMADKAMESDTYAQHIEVEDLEKIRSNYLGARVGLTKYSPHADEYQFLKRDAEHWKEIYELKMRLLKMHLSNSL